MKRLKRVVAGQCDNLVQEFAKKTEEAVLSAFSDSDEEFVETVLSELAPNLDENTLNAIYNDVLADPENKLNIDFVAEYRKLLSLVQKHITAHTSENQ